MPGSSQKRSTRCVAASVIHAVTSTRIGLPARMNPPSPLEASIASTDGLAWYEPLVPSGQVLNLVLGWSSVPKVPRPSRSVPEKHAVEGRLQRGPRSTV